MSRQRPRFLPRKTMEHQPVAAHGTELIEQTEDAQIPQLPQALVRPE